jgi:hypothetical protein
MEKRQQPMVRVNTRIRVEQDKFIKAKAKRENLTEGEAIRLIIDSYMGKA